MPDQLFDDVDLNEFADAHENDTQEEQRKLIKSTAGAIAAHVKKLVKDGDLNGLQALARGNAPVDTVPKTQFDEVVRERNTLQSELNKLKPAKLVIEETPPKDATPPADDADKTKSKAKAEEKTGTLRKVGTFFFPSTSKSK